jgi:hypothetical protein
MKKYVVFSSNDNLKYLYYRPLITWCWNHFGWDTIMLYQRSGGPTEKLKAIEQLTEDTYSRYREYDNAIRILKIDNYKSETIAQVSRLYGVCAAYPDDSYVMTSDIDMLPLSKNIFHYEGHRVLTIGRDLTDYHYPICYIGARSNVWREFMQLSDTKFNSTDFHALMLRDMRHQKNMWGLDQDIVTEKLLAYGPQNINHINRGTDKRTGYPLGRVDRSNWRLDHEKLIDAHLPHDILTNDKSFHKVMELLHHVWPLEDFKWFLDYHKEFKKLL